MKASLLHGIVFSLANSEIPCLQVCIFSCCPSTAIFGRAVGSILLDQGYGIFPTSYPCPRKSQILWTYRQELWYYSV